MGTKTQQPNVVLYFAAPSVPLSSCSRNMDLLPYPLPCHTEKDYQSQSGSSSLHSESSSSSSSSSSLSSQLSLPSVPSLTPSFSKQREQTSAIHHHCLATLKGHSSYVPALALAGKFLFSGSSNSELRSWKRDPSALDELNSSADNVVASSNGAVKALVVLGDKLFSAHQDHKIRVWRIDSNNNIHQNYACIATLPTVNDRFLKCFSSKNYVQVRRHKKCTWVHHVDTVSSLAVSRDGCLLYSASWDRTFKVWRTMDFRCLESVSNAHDDAINAIVLSNDGFVYTGSADKKIKVWRKQAAEKKHSLVETIERHKSAVNALALSTDGSVLYSGACDRSILVWEKDCNLTGEGHIVLVGALRGHAKAILCLAVVSDLVCSGSADNTVRIWRRESEKIHTCLAVFEGHRKPVKCLAASIDHSNNRSSSDSATGGTTSYLVYSGSLDCDVKVWNIRVPNSLM